MEAVRIGLAQAGDEQGRGGGGAVAAAAVSLGMRVAELLSAGPLACELPGTARSVLISEESGLCSGCPAGLGGAAHTCSHLSLTISPPADLPLLISLLPGSCIMSGAECAGCSRRGCQKPDPVAVVVFSGNLLVSHLL